MIRYSLFVLLFFVWGCRNTPTEEKGTFEIDWEKSERIKNEFAAGFNIQKSSDYFRISISDPQTGTAYGAYVLYPSNKEKPLVKQGEMAIGYPLKSFASVSTTHLPFLKLLNEQHKLTGFAGHKFVLDKDYTKLFSEGKVAELGADNALNHEKLIELFPDVLMVYPFGTLNFDKITAAGIPVFHNTDYLELHPLGKAEWIKVFGILFDKQKEADSLFAGIKNRYDRAKSVFGYFSVDQYPTVFTGLNFSGTWYVPGGKSYQAQMLKDAWVDYVWRNDPHNNSLTLSQETVIDLCIDTDFWVIVSAEKENFGYDDLMKQNAIYSNFKAAKNRNIIFCNSNEKDFFGQAIVEPDVILQDLIHFFYNEKMDYLPKYFYRLK